MIHTHVFYSKANNKNYNAFKMKNKNAENDWLTALIIRKKGRYLSDKIPKSFPAFYCKVNNKIYTVFKRKSKRAENGCANCSNRWTKK